MTFNFRDKDDSLTTISQYLMINILNKTEI